MSNVFDPLVFDVGVFDTSFFIPVLLDFWVEKEYKRVALGQVVIIRARVMTTAENNRRYLFNPSISPTFTVYGPDGLVRLLNGPMQNIATGVYQGIYQTGVIFDSTVFDPNVFDTGVHDLPGVYLVSCHARDGGYDMQTLKAEAFEVVGG
jgi:hypothetical protein